MKALCATLLLCLVTGSQVLLSQKLVDKVKFFEDENPIQATLTTDIAKLLGEKMKGDNLSATFTCKLSDSIPITQEILINARGKYRRSYCYMPPMRLIFKNPASPILYSLNTLKLVCGCKTNSFAEQLLLKEYLAYKIYNLLTPKSFLTRLMKITYEDSKGKKKSFSQYAFFVENVDVMAKRNGCKELKSIVTDYSLLDRDQVTLMTLFEYMIGNTDWGLTNKEVNHNLKLIYSKVDSNSKPYAIPYDFDHSGLVNADYAVPNPELGIQNVVQRLYRGFPRNINDLQTAFQIFNQQREKIYALVNEFELLDAKNKKEMIAYLNDFYKVINKDRDVQTIFIKNARLH